MTTVTAWAICTVGNDVPLRPLVSFMFTSEDAARSYFHRHYFSIRNCVIRRVEIRVVEEGE